MNYLISAGHGGFGMPGGKSEFTAVRTQFSVSGTAQFITFISGKNSYKVT